MGRLTPKMSLQKACLFYCWLSVLCLPNTAMVPEEYAYEMKS